MTDQAAKTTTQAKQAGKSAPEDPAAEAARLRAEAAAIEAALPPSPGTVRVRVEAPHAEFWLGGVGVGTEPTEVPEHLVPALMQSASEAGVTLTQEG